MFQNCSSPAPKTAACLRYGETDWDQVGESQGLGDCVASLYSGLCDHSQVAISGRWGDRTLRLVGGRVEMSLDGRSFRTLQPRAPGCAAAAPPG